jgi:DnaK suppressor protein
MAALYRAPGKRASIVLYSDFFSVIGWRTWVKGGRMNQRDLKLFRKLLDEKMAELLAEADRTVDVMNEKENFPDPTDRASLESNRNFTLRIRDRERKLIGKIKEAIERIDDGSYGKCEECGEKIGLERLKARPVTTLCIDCKSLQEAEERKLRGAH